MRLLTVARDLRRRKAREREGLFVAEGVRAVEEVLRSGVVLRGALVGPQLLEAPRGVALAEALRARGVLVDAVSEREFASAADTESPQGVLAVGVIPSPVWPVAPVGTAIRVLVLDAVQDPGNVGTLTRTAAALGVAATIALPGTVDLWNAKVVRSAMGAQCHHAAFAASWEEFEAWRVANQITLWGADHRGADIRSVAPAPTSLAMAVGNEGAGLSDAVRASCDRLVAIPITGAVESLNVAVAAGILLQAVRP